MEVLVSCYFVINYKCLIIVMVQCAKLEENTNRVVEVIESSSLKWCKKNLPGTWVKNTSDTKIARDFIYYPEHGSFSHPRPFPSWTLDDTLTWNPPVPEPTDSGRHKWDEDTQTWEVY